MMEMVRRRNATKKTLDEWRGQLFDWDSQRSGTCAHLLYAHLVNMGHKPPSVPDFDTPLCAVRALKSMGHENITDLLNNLLPRRPSVGFMRLGDVALAPGDGPLDAVFICAGPLKVFGWHETRNDLVVQDVSLDKLLGAWET